MNFATELCDQDESITWRQLMQALQEEHIPTLPPGGGLPSK